MIKIKKKCNWKINYFLLYTKRSSAAFPGKSAPHFGEPVL